MNKLKLKALTQEYSGRCKIIPCCDLPKIESNFDDLKDDIIDAFKDQRIICNWSLKDGVLEKYKDKDFTEDEIEKIGTLGVNYEFVHDMLKNADKFNTSGGNVKENNR